MIDHSAEADAGPTDMAPRADGPDGIDPMRGSASASGAAAEGKPRLAGARNGETRETDKRRSLIAATREALVEGAGEFEIGDVARRAGVSVGLAYHHFGSKAGLLKAVVEDFYDRYDAVTTAPKSRSVPWFVRERERLAELVAFLSCDPMASLVIGTMAVTAEIAAVEAERRGQIIAGATAVIREGQETGAVDPALDPSVTAAIYVGGLREAFTRWLEAGRPGGQEGFVEKAWTPFERAMRR